MSQRAFALFVGLHGIVHVVGFTVPWGLGGPRGVDYSTSLLGGALEVGDLGVKLVGIVWLALAGALVGAAVLLWRRHPAALTLTFGLLLASMALCVLGLPESLYGLGIDVVLLGLLAVIPERLASAVPQHS